MFTANVPGMPLHITERTIWDMLIVDCKKVRFPDWGGAHNFFILRTFAAACENDISYQAAILTAQDSTWDIFTSAIPPPIFGRGAALGKRAASIQVWPRLHPTADWSLPHGLEL